MFPDPYTWSMGTFGPAEHLTHARNQAVSGPMGDDGYAFVAGGGAAEGEAYAFVTLKTDKDDYAPGESALITGSGWQPGEEVTLVFQEDPAVHPDYTLTLTAEGTRDGRRHDESSTARRHRTPGQMTFTDSVVGHYYSANQRVLFRSLKAEVSQWLSAMSRALEHKCHSKGSQAHT